MHEKIAKFKKKLEIFKNCDFLVYSKFFQRICYVLGIKYLQLH